MTSLNGYSKDIPASLCGDLRLRDVAKLVRVANSHPCSVRIVHAGGSVNGKSLIEVSRLGRGPRTGVRLSAEGAGARECVEALWRLMDRRTVPAAGWVRVPAPAGRAPQARRDLACSAC